LPLGDPKKVACLWVTQKSSFLRFIAYNTATVQGSFGIFYVNVEHLY